MDANLLATRVENTEWLERHVQELSDLEPTYLDTLLDIAAEALTIYVQFEMEKR
jgi:hypothetical protein